MSNADSQSPDPGMLELFQAEMDTHIPVLNDGLLALEKGGVDAAQIEAMMRAAHSIKGAARIVGIPAAVRVAHAMEDCFTAAKENRIVLKSEYVDVLLQGTDTLQKICSGKDEAAINADHLQGLIEQIAGVRDGKQSSMPVAEVSKGLVAANVRRDEPSILLPAVLDLKSTDALRRELLDTLRLNPTRIALDFSQVSALTAGALALLVSFVAESARVTPPPLLFASGASSAVSQVLSVAGLKRAFHVT